jgi:protein O-mannosyl-transferase
MPKHKNITSMQTAGTKSEYAIASLQRLRTLAGTGLIVAVVFLVYFPSISGSFILDDDILLTDNKAVKAHDGFFRLWHTAESLEYYPVTYDAFWIEWRLWGMHTTGYKITNLILHIVEVLLIWLILRRLSIPGAFLAAMIFAVHPINVESAAWIAQRRNMLAMLFVLLSILWYLKLGFRLPTAQDGISRSPLPLARRLRPLASGPSLLWYWLSITAFVLAMLSKGSAAVLPILLLGIIWWLRPMTWRDLVRLSPFFVIAVLFSAVNVWFQTHETGEAIRTAGFVERLLGAGGVVWFYLYKAILPFDLVFIYPQWNIQVGNVLWWLPLLAALIVTAVLWQYRNKWGRPFLFAWGFFCVALIPVMGFADVGFMKYSLVADHYQHIAVIGIITLLAALWSIWQQSLSKSARWAALAVAFVVVGTLALQTWSQSRLYGNVIALYRQTLEKNPDCFLIHNNLGLVLVQNGKPREAIEHYRQALRLKHTYSDACNNLGIVLMQTDRAQEAIEYYRKAVDLKPNYTAAHNNLGVALVQTGQPQEAIAHYEEAVRLQPDYVDAHNNLALALTNTGRLLEAIEQCKKSLLINPDSPDAHNNLGIALFRTGRMREAIEQFEQTLHLKPDHAKACKNLCLSYAGTHQSSKAIAAAQKAIELARSQGQAAEAQQIADWLNAYRAGLSDRPDMPPPAKSAFPTP